MLKSKSEALFISILFIDKNALICAKDLVQKDASAYFFFFTEFLLLFMGLLFSNLMN